MFVYLMVSKDKYELPVAVADSVQELSDMVGSSVNTIRSGICHQKAGRIKKSRFICVDVEDDDD